MDWDKFLNKKPEERKINGINNLQPFMRFFFTKLKKNLRIRENKTLIIVFGVREVAQWVKVPAVQAQASKLGSSESIVRGELRKERW